MTRPYDIGKKCFGVFAECLSLRGDSLRRPLVTLENLAASLPYGIALTKENVYWTDWKKSVSVTNSFKLLTIRSHSEF